MQHVISSILPIFIITILGKVIRVYWLQSKDFWRSLESLCYHMLIPVVLFNYISYADFGAFHLMKLILSLVIATLIISAGLILFNKKWELDGKLFTSIFQGSTKYSTYMFFALGDSLLDREGMVIVAVISAYMIIFTNIISIAVFAIYAPPEDDISQQRGESKIISLLKNMIANPLILASILGFAFNHFGIDLSRSIHKTLFFISDSAYGVGLLCVGSNLRFDIMHINRFAIIITSMAKLVFFPVITFFIMKLAGVKDLAFKVGMLYSAIPTSTNSYLITKKLGGDHKSMSSIITSTIILSILSLTVLMYILR